MHRDKFGNETLFALLKNVISPGRGTAAFGQAVKELKRPNIHVVRVDDNSSWTVGAYTHGMMGRMPDIDSIANEVMSGGGIEFMRRVENTNGFPPGQEVGSGDKTRFEMRKGRPVLVKLPEWGSIDLGPEKPVNINLHFGRQPITVIGNPGGDLRMLQ